MAAAESWDDVAVVAAEPPEIKLFGRWSAIDVQVGDISLTVSAFAPSRRPFAALPTRMLGQTGD